MSRSNSKSTGCDHELLLKSLDDALSEVQEAALERHLTDCRVCQHDLAELAGSRHDWSSVSSVLKREVAATRWGEHGPHVPPAEADPQAEAAEALSADFAVEFLDPPQTPEAIGRLGEIEILGVVGRGGMGVVLKGYQPELKRLVAVKVLAPHLAVDVPARKRFAREAQAAAAILHPNAMPIFAVHSGGRLPYLVMPFLVCESLEQRVARAGALPLVDVLRIGMQTALGLAAAHAQGLVHRDVKPANILLEFGVDRAMLTDFGLARAIDDAGVTRTGLIAGTPQYMSPEQVRDEPLDGRSDLFSLGSVLYAMATGRPPFRAETSYGLLRRITDSAARPACDVNPEVPLWLSAFIDRLLAKAPADRLASAQLVAATLEQCLAHVRQPNVTPLPASCAVRRPRPLLRWGIAGLFACEIVAWGVWRSDAEPDQPVPAPQIASLRPFQAPPVVRAADPAANVQRPAKSATAWNTAAEELLEDLLNPQPDPERSAGAGTFRQSSERPSGEEIAARVRDELAAPTGFVGSRRQPADRVALSADERLDERRGESPPLPRPLAPTDGREAGQVRDDNELKMQFAWCPPGVVRMGDIVEEGQPLVRFGSNQKPQVEPYEFASNDGVPSVRAILTRGYWLGRHEVTQAEWWRLMATEPWRDNPKVEAGGDLPAAPIVWGQALEFCRALTECERQAGRLPAGWEYTLPTEAQWERACRARSETMFCFGDAREELGAYAWFRDNTAEEHPRRVGQKKPNAWGLCDMHGNVWEWCRDFFAPELPGGRDPLVTTESEFHVCRGGAFASGPPRCRSASRGRLNEDLQNVVVGFRVALVPTVGLRETPPSQPRRQPSANDSPAQPGGATPDAP